MSGKTLYERLCGDPRTLNEAWEEVRRNARKLSRGVDDETLLQFSSDSQKRLRTIRLLLRDKKFKFSKLRASSVLKRDGSPRPIQVAAIKDRVVLKGIELLIRAKLDERYNVFNNPVSFAFIRTEDIKEYDFSDPQTHKGVRGAVEKLRSYVLGGYTWCVKADIIEFFPSAHRNDILKNYIFPTLKPDTSLNNLVRAAFKVEVEISEDIKRIFGNKTDIKFEANTGLPQGSVLSPLFSNVYLSNFDNVMSESGYIVLRYVDDFLILCISEAEARKAYKLAVAELSKLGLKIHSLSGKGAKTEIKRTEDITFLGIRLKDKKFYPSSDAFERYKEKLSVVPKYKSLAKNLQHLHSLTQSWGISYSFCSNDPNAYKELNKVLDSAVNRSLYKARLKVVFGTNPRQLRRLGIRRFDDSVAYFSQNKKLATKLRFKKMARSST